MKQFYKTIITLLLLFTSVHSVLGQVTAGFIDTPSSGCAPLVVNFTNTSTPVSGTTYVWNMDNGTGTITLTNPSTSYLTAGIYTVTLTATHGSSSSTVTHTITVRPSPTVSFSVSDTAMCPGVPATYTSTTISGDPSPAQLLWSFGDGYTDSTYSTTVTHAIGLPGYFNITLKATNSWGCTSLLTQNALVHVYTPPAPVITATATHICPHNWVTFSAGVSGTPPYTYVWNFGDGTATSSSASPAHQYNSPGTYTVRLTVTDGHGCEDSVTRTNYITVSNMSPSFTGPDSACIKIPVAFTNTSINYLSDRWLYGNGSSGITTNGNTTYLTPGTFNVSLITYDGFCYDTLTKPIVIPNPASTFTITPAHPCPAPETSNFTTTLPYGATVVWDFGDSTTGSGAFATHTYTKDQFDSVVMYVSYGPGCKDTESYMYKIYDLNVYETKSAILGGCIPLSVDFGSEVNTSFPRPYGGPYPYGPYHYSWSYGDGSPIDTSGGFPTHVYTAVGVYPLLFTLTTANGCVRHVYDTVKAGVKPMATFTATPTRECYRNNEIGFTRTLLSGPADLYYWLFGEGKYGYGQYDTVSTAIATTYHHFTIPGIFSDTLIAFYHGCPDTFIRPRYITIDSPMSIPVTSYECSPLRGVSFANRSLGDNWHEWYFGDGGTSLLDTVLHVYPHNGIYEASLITYNDSSHCHDTALTYIDFVEPIVHITASDTAICKNQWTTITAHLDSGYVSKYEWHIGTFVADSLTGILVDTFKVPGRYTVEVIVYDQHLCPDTISKPNYILVAQPVDHFTVSPSSICWPSSTTITDGTTDQPGTFISNYKWTLGDGNIISGSSSFVHTYTATGTYSIKEVVTDNLGCKDSLTQTASLYHPVASFSPSATHVCAYTQIIFTNTSTPPGATYTWDFGDGRTSTAGSPSYAYSDSGHFTVTMKMTDPHGCRDSAKMVIKVSKPHAAFSMDDSVAVCPPFLVHFYNHSNGAANYYWNLGNGSISIADSPSNIYTIPAYDTVLLVAIDSAGCRDSAIQHVKVYGYTGAFSYTPDNGCAPMTVQFNADLTNIALATSITWDFSDGITSTGSISDTTHHVYLPGRYVPKLIITDHTGCVASSLGADTIYVDGIKPGSKVHPNPVCPGDTVRLTDTSASYWSAITKHDWTYAGGTLIGSSVAVVYTVSGTYAVTLHDTDGWGCTAIIVDTITVRPLPDSGRITSNLVNAFCLGFKIEVQDTAAGGTGIWRLSNDHITISGDTLTAMSPGTDTLYYTVTNACGTAVAMDTFTVQPPVPPIAGRKGLCVGDTVILSDSLFGGMWQGGNANIRVTSSLQDSGIVVGIAAGTAVITYQMDLGCATTTTVTVNSLPVTNRVPLSVKCFGGNDGSITVTPDSSTAPYKYSWSNGATTASLTSLSGGDYKVVIKDTVAGCMMTDSFHIAMPDSLSITDSISNDICFSPNGSISVIVVGGTSPYQYQWSNKGTGSEISGLTSGQYDLMLIDFNGCSVRYSFLLSDSSCPTVIIHNAISPNGDGINETWVIEHIQNYPKNVVQVFDKWGDKIFEQQDYKNDWYGLGKDGKVVPDGTYYYLVKLNPEYATHEKSVFTGSLLIKR